MLVIPDVVRCGLQYIIAWNVNLVDRILSVRGSRTGGEDRLAADCPRFHQQRPPCRTPRQLRDTDKLLLYTGETLQATRATGNQFE